MPSRRDSLVNMLWVPGTGVPGFSMPSLRDSLQTIANFNILNALFCILQFWMLTLSLSADRHVCQLAREFRWDIRSNVNFCADHAGFLVAISPIRRLVRRCKWGRRTMACPGLRQTHAHSNDQFFLNRFVNFVVRRMS